MTICEYVRQKYIEYVETPDHKKPCLINIERGSYEYFKTFCEFVCDGAWDFEFRKAGITQEQIDYALTQKYIYKKEYSNWEARQKGQTKAYILTVKGKKTVYDYYPEW